ncbi:MAG TPA: hypothetical protein VHC91_13595 [Trinickia sp.]|uniref:hypothetical protein n=1 Tax=Trinickia sp. TaxID=2571163 RepID=UPI002CDB5D1B|nr:hypothetical protein [Trinickia sp.]HVW51410.1 hypothetical protein [Trinickia sp.]
MPDPTTLASAVFTPPVYSDWTFWSSAIAFVALSFSVGPLIWKWLRPPKLELELYDRVALTHKVGNPNLQAHLIIRNVGGREARISSVTASVARDGGAPYVLPARNYLPSAPATGQTLAFSPFTVKTGDQWANVVNFIAPWGRENEQRYRGLHHALREHINQRLEQREPGNRQAIIADDALVAPLIAMYEGNNNRWRPGQYELVVKVTTTSKRVQVEQRYRFSVFEADAEELRKLTDEYEMGFGIYLNSQREPWIYPEVVRV